MSKQAEYPGIPESAEEGFNIFAAISEALESEQAATTRVDQLLTAAYKVHGDEFLRHEVILWDFDLALGVNDDGKVVRLPSGVSNAVLASLN